MNWRSREIGVGSSTTANPFLFYEYLLGIVSVEWFEITIRFCLFSGHSTKFIDYFEYQKVFELKFDDLLRLTRKDEGESKSSKLAGTLLTSFAMQKTWLKCIHSFLHNYEISPGKTRCVVMCKLEKGSKCEGFHKCYPIEHLLPLDSCVEYLGDSEVEYVYPGSNCCGSGARRAR